MPENARFMKRYVFAFAVLCCFAGSAVGQTKSFKATSLDKRISGLSEELGSYDLFTIDIGGIDAYVHDEAYSNAIVVELPGYGRFDMDLIAHDIRSENYKLRIATSQGIQVMPRDPRVKSFRGGINGQYEVRLTIDSNYINGFIATSAGDLYIESARLRDKAAPVDEILVYYNHDVIAEYPNECEPLQVPTVYSEESEENLPSRAIGECLDVQIALADDWLMYEERNENLSDVENHNISVINSLQVNYDDEFEDELQFIITEIFVSTCSTCDPWTSSTNAGDLLDDFGGWGNNGFDNPHDVGGLWTDRDFNGQTIGLAWLASVCFNQFKYHTCQDFTSNMNFLRVLQAHEMGHNFSASHDSEGSPHIMAPTIQNTSSWSVNSVNDISDYVAGVGCLSNCASQQPPVADIGSDVVEGCVPLTVEFEDNSVGSPSSWTWTFPGGTPSSSTAPNPTVVYQDAGTFDVSLEVGNAAGSNSITLQDYITVLPFPEPDFGFTTDELTVFFENLSVNADSYDWDFGDGNVSNDSDPTHTYDADGLYTVILTASNSCGDEQFIYEIEVVSLPIAAFTFDPGEGCMPLTVDFENISTPNAETFLWEFEGGDPVSSNDENPTVIYEAPGVYGVTLTVSNGAGEDMAALQDVIVVNPLTEANFTASVEGNTAEFTNMSTDAFAYLWDFGDGITSNQFEPTHVYAVGGVYIVMLIAEGDCGPDTAFVEVSVAAAPVAGLGVSVSEGCAPLEVQYSSLSSGEVETYNWTFPGGSPSSSNESDPIVTYNTPGTYSATLVVTNPIGSDMITVTNAVTVLEDVIADFSFNPNGQQVQFVNESSNEQSVEWQINGEVYNIPNPIVNFGMDGEFEAVLIATGPCGSDTATTVITIATPPTAGFSISGNTDGCAPLAVQFNDESTENVSQWAWEFPGGNPASSTEPSPVVTYETAGVYSVSLTVTSGGGTDEFQMNDLIAVGDVPDASFLTNQSGTEVVFNNATDNADTYQWFFGDGTTSNEAAPTHVYNEFGEYEVMLIATNSCGSDTATFLLELLGLPVPDFFAAETVGCVPFEVTFEDLSQNEPESWAWTFEGGNPASSGQPNPTVTYNTPGVYEVSLRVANSSGALTLVRDAFIIVEDVPVAGFDSEATGDQVQFTNASQGAASYMWHFGDGTQSEEENPDHIYAASGTYNVVLIASNLCGSDTFALDVTVETSSYNYPELEASVELWPNPNAGEFTIDVQNYSGDLEVTLVDIQGRRHFEGVLLAPGQIRISRSDNLAPGMYIAIIADSGSRLFRKVIIK